MHRGELSSQKRVWIILLRLPNFPIYYNSTVGAGKQCLFFAALSIPPSALRLPSSFTGGEAMRDDVGIVPYERATKLQFTAKRQSGHTRLPLDYAFI